MITCFVDQRPVKEVDEEEEEELKEEAEKYAFALWTVEETSNNALQAMNAFEVFHNICMQVVFKILLHQELPFSVKQRFLRRALLELVVNIFYQMKGGREE